MQLQGQGLHGIPSCLGFSVVSDLLLVWGLVGLGFLQRLYTSSISDFMLAPAKNRTLRTKFMRWGRTDLWFLDSVSVSICLNP